MIDGKTRTGFEYSFNERVVRDARFIEKLSSLTKDDLSALSFVMNRLLGEEQKEKLYDHVAENDPDGIADVTKVNDELEDIIKAVGESEKK